MVNNFKVLTTTKSQFLHQNINLEAHYGITLSFSSNEAKHIQL